MVRPRHDNEPLVSTCFRIPRSVYEQLHKAAKERDLSIAWLGRRAIEKFLDELIPVDEIQWTREREKGKGPKEWRR